MLNVYLVVCVKKCSFALNLCVRKCKLSMLSCVEKCNDLTVSCVRKCNYSSDTSRMEMDFLVSVSAMQPFFKSLCLLPLLQHY